MKFIEKSNGIVVVNYLAFVLELKSVLSLKLLLSLVFGNYYRSMKAF